MRKMILPATVMTIKRSAVQRTELVPRLRGQRKLGRVLASIKIIVLFAASVTLKHSVPEDLPWRTSAGTSGMSSSAILAERRVTSLTDVRTSGVESFDPWLQELSPQPPLGMQPLRTQHARSLNKEALPSENSDLQSLFKTKVWQEAKEQAELSSLGLFSELKEVCLRGKEISTNKNYALAFKHFNVK
ncbi:uncharacterized protein LOC132728925 [Ruditapes philippinarum]|uniref:uncharacterized protein LOC132728925 n=1 Tax=Ruditapes philippinarum TaxID=129788 RepID=UPI00295B9D96|nr:uncharacterized protein LOC132728925 [Ruditapes philippinarum]